MPAGNPDGTVPGTDNLPIPDGEIGGAGTVSIILLAEKSSQLSAPFRSIVKMLLRNVVEGFGAKLDIIVAVKENDTESGEEFFIWNNSSMIGKSQWKISVVVRNGKMGALLAEAIGKADGDIIAFLTRGFLIDREALATGLVNNANLSMQFGVSFVKGHYGISSRSGADHGGRLITQAPYTRRPYDVSSFGGMREYGDHFPFRHLSTIRVKKSLVSKYLDFLSEFDAGLDIAMGAIAVHEGAGIRTTPDPFVNMLTVSPPPDPEVLKREIALMRDYFHDMNEYTGRAYFDYIEGANADVESGRY